MWQFMKGTAKCYGLRVDSWVDERRDPYRATDAAARHLRDLNERFGSLYLAAAAYNAGARQGLARAPPPAPTTTPTRLNADATFFRLYDTKLLRRETKDYVPKLIAAALIAKEPARYGFTVDAGRAAGVRLDRRAHDDRPRRHRPAGGHDRRGDPRAESAVPAAGDAAGRARRWCGCPPGRGPTTVAAYAELPPERRVTFVEHIVASGRDDGRHRPALSREQPARSRMRTRG